MGSSSNHWKSFTLIRQIDQSSKILLSDWADRPIHENLQPDWAVCLIIKTFTFIGQFVQLLYIKSFTLIEQFVQSTKILHFDYSVRSIFENPTLWLSNSSKHWNPSLWLGSLSNYWKSFTLIGSSSTLLKILHSDWQFVQLSKILPSVWEARPIIGYPSLWLDSSSIHQKSFTLIGQFLQ